MNPIEIFKSLNGKKVRILSEGLLIEGNFEGYCTLHYVEHSGLHCLVDIQHNMANVVGQIEQLIMKGSVVADMSYKQRDDLIAEITPELMTVKVQAGRIPQCFIKSIMTYYNHGYTPEKYVITYTNNNSVSIIIQNN